MEKCLHLFIFFLNQPNLYNIFKFAEEHRDRNQKKRQVQKYIESNQCSEKVPNICVCDPPGIYINNTTFDADNTNVAKEEFLLVPPASTMDFGLSFCMLRIQNNITLF